MFIIKSLYSGGKRSGMGPVLGSVPLRSLQKWTILFFGPKRCAMLATFGGGCVSFSRNETLEWAAFYV